MHRTLLLIAVSALAGAAAASVASAPAADAVPREAGRTLFRFEPGRLRAVVAGSGTSMSTSYVLDYALTSASASAAKPRIRLEMRTETGKTHPDAADPAAFAAAARLLRAKEPPPSTATLRGTDVDGNATVRGLACFGTVDPHADVLEVRVSGLFDRVYRDRQGRIFTENRVLVLRYHRPGDSFDRAIDPVTLTGTREEVVGAPVQLNAK